MIQTTDKLPRWWIWLILGVAAIAVIAYFLNRHYSEKYARIEAIQTKESEIQIVKETIGKKTAENLTKNTSAIQSSESDVKVAKNVVKKASEPVVVKRSDSVIYSEDFQRWLKEEGSKQN